MEQLNFFSSSSTVSVGQLASSVSLRLSPPIVMSTCFEVSALAFDAVLEAFADEVPALEAEPAAEPLESVFVPPQPASNVVAIVTAHNNDKTFFPFINSPHFHYFI